MISYGKQHLDNSDIKAVIDVLKGSWLTQGPKIEKFEKALGKKFGAKYCCAVANGTAALHLTGIGLEWKPKDIVITSPISFLASANCIVYSGATPDFVDIDEKNYTIDPNKLEKKIKYYLNRNKKVKAIVATDFAGNPCDWQALKQVSYKYDIQLVNDNCHALGAHYKKDKFYAPKFADVVTQSYHPVKNITTGEGGAVLSNNDEFSKKIKILRSHGIERKLKNKNSKQGSWFYEMNEIGYNYRITDFQCALGISQLAKLEKFVKKRNYLANIYNNYFQEVDIFQIPEVQKKSKHAFHIYPLLINFEKINLTKNILFEKMLNYNIKLQVHYIPIHLQPYYKKYYGFKKGDFPIAEKFYNREVSLPIYFSLKDKEIKTVIKYLKKFCK